MGNLVSKSDGGNRAPSAVAKVALVAAGLAIALGVIASAGCAPGSKKTEQATRGKTEAEAPVPGGKGFKEYPIGEPKEVKGLNVSMVYFQPVEMEPKSGPGPDEADLHLEADIAAAKGNEYGFGVGEFVPNLTVKYEIKKKDTGETIEGSMMPMNASDGAHYGNNVKMLGAGNYEITLMIDAPDKQGYVLHKDEDTGVKGSFWKKPIVLTYDFPFVPKKW